MKIPTNLIQTKYTTGGELIYKNTNTPYKGYYYVLNDSFFAGKNFNVHASELIKIEDSNKLLNNSSTMMYSLISGKSSQQLVPKSIRSFHFDNEIVNTDTRYFIRNLNIYPILIKEVTKTTYNSVKNDHLYQTTFINTSQSIEQADKQLPGLKAWLLG